MRSFDALGRARLPVYTRRVASEGKVIDIEAVVACPRRLACVSVDDCLACEQRAGFSFDRDRGVSYALCHTHPVVDDGGYDRVADVMSADVLCVSEDMTIDEVTAVLLEEDVRSAPVVDSARRAVGMISRADLLRDQPGDTRVTQVMMALPFCVRADAAITEAAALMAYEEVHQVPVVSEDDKVVGLVTSIDVLRWLANRAGPPRSELT